jgi:hypothetical protein
MSKACSTHGREEEYTRDFGGKTRKKRPLERPRRRCENNIKMDRRELEIVWYGLNSPGSG